MSIFHSPAGQPKTVYVTQLPVTANEPCTFTQDNSHVTLAPATDGKSVVLTCTLPLTTSSIVTNLHATTPEGVVGSCQVSFDPDPSLAQSVTLTDVPPA